MIQFGLDSLTASRATALSALMRHLRILPKLGRGKAHRTALSSPLLALALVACGDENDDMAQPAIDGNGSVIDILSQDEIAQATDEGRVPLREELTREERIFGDALFDDVADAELADAPLPSPEDAVPVRGEETGIAPEKLARGGEDVVASATASPREGSELSPSPALSPRGGEEVLASAPLGAGRGAGELASGATPTQPATSVAAATSLGTGAETTPPFTTTATAALVEEAGSNLWLYLGGLGIVAVAGGGGGGGVPLIQVAGQVFDGPIQGARVYVDVDGDGAYGTGDIEIAISDANGFYAGSFAATHKDKFIRVDLTNAFDTDPNNDDDPSDRTQLDGQVSYRSAAPIETFVENGSAVVALSPLTTLVADEFDTSASDAKAAAAAAAEKIASDLGLSVGSGGDILKNLAQGALDSDSSKGVTAIADAAIIDEIAEAASAVHDVLDIAAETPNATKEDAYHLIQVKLNPTAVTDTARVKMVLQDAETTPANTTRLGFDEQTSGTTKIGQLVITNAGSATIGLVTAANQPVAANYPFTLTRVTNTDVWEIHAVGGFDHDAAGAITAWTLYVSGGALPYPIAVNLTDIADTAAQFAEDSYSFTAAENIGASEIIGNIAATPDVYGGAITYAITAGNTSGNAFSVDANGNIKVAAGALDHEGGTTSYTLTVSATEAGFSGTADTTQVTITVTDANDTAPSFSGATSFTIAETATSVGTVSASAGESDLTGATAISYEIDASDTNNGIFSIDRTSGAITVRAGALNADGASPTLSYTVKVKAIATHATGTTSHVQDITVTITDAADEGPTFTSTTLSTAAQVPSGVEAARVVATADISSDAVTYALASTNTNNKFTVAANGAINRTANGTLTAGQSETIIVTATDENGFSTTESITLTIVNDEAPTFTDITTRTGTGPTGITASINENHSNAQLFSGVKTATDSDNDDSAITYSVTARDGNKAIDWFIVTNAGDIRFGTNKVAHDVDAPNNGAVITITLTAHSGFLSVSREFTLNINDLHDQGPIFTSADTASVTEGTTAATNLVTLAATPDVSGTVSFALKAGVSDNTPFEVVNGVLRLKAAQTIDFETKASYNVVVTASNTVNSVTHTTDQTIVVSVANIRDSGPVFTTTSASVDENSPAATAILTLDAMPDGGGTHAVSYTLKSGVADNTPFEIVNGVLRLKAGQSIDHESGKTSYGVVVIASDTLDGVTYTTEQTITVNVNDLTETAPTWNGGLSGRGYTVNEGFSGVITASTLFTSILTIDAPGRPITWTLTGDNPTENGVPLFSMNSGHRLNVARPLDHEVQGRYILNLTATVDGFTSSGLRLTIDIRDINETPPVFTSADVISVREDQALASIFHTLTATTDVGAPNFSESVQNAVFETLLAGGLRLTSALDHESGTTSYSYVVRAVVSQVLFGVTYTTQATQTLTINVIDVNDTAPLFSGTTSFSVAENMTSIGTVSASGESDLNGLTISYAIDSSDTNNGIFSIDSASGAITVNAGVLDADGDSLAYTVRVKATATHATGTTSHVQDITVTVTDVNDVAPIFTSSNQAFVASNQAGEEILTLAATPDLAGDSVVYAFDNSGTHNNDQFTIEGDKLKLAAGATLVPGAGLTARVKATAGALSTVQIITVVTVSGMAEVLVGTAGADTFLGGGVADKIRGAGGDDVIQGLGGGDILKGEEGNDTLSYSLDAAGVVVDLSQTFYNGYIWVGGNGTSHAEGDRISGFENLIGGGGNDTLIGDVQANIIKGGAGNDTLEGGGGNDTADFSDKTDSVAVNLGGRADSDGYIYAHIDGVAEDKLKGFEYLIGGAGADTLIASDGDNIIEGGAGGDTMVGGAGNDTLSYVSDTVGVTVSLAQAAETTGDDAGYIVVAGNAGSHAEGDKFKGFENLIGGSGNDNLTGDAGVNVIEGGAGDDTLQGGLGADRLLGGAGGDTLDYSGRLGDVVARLSGTADLKGFISVSVNGVAEDKIKGIEHLVGGSGDDVLGGNNSDGAVNELDGGAGTDTADFSYVGLGQAVVANLGGTVDGSGFITATIGGAAGAKLKNIENLIGGAGSDTLTGRNNESNVLEGGAGADTLIGGTGTGIDVASYANASSAVAIYLANMSVNSNDAAGDTYTSIEKILGSAYGDTFVGDANNNIFEGGAGADVIDGAGGNDTASYATARAGVKANLASASSNTGDAAGDIYTSIENLTGSAHDDSLTGNSGVNVLIGGAGNDTLDGGAGADILRGGAGDDTLKGGAGNDTIEGGAGRDTLSYAGRSASVTVNLGASPTGGYITANGDSFSGIENVTGGAGVDTLTGKNNESNVIEGGAGGDKLDGGSGTGSDTLSYAGSTYGVTVNLGQAAETAGANQGYILVSATDNTISIGGDSYVADAAGDRIKGFENLIGSGRDDVITGDGSANVLSGGAGGFDVLDGGAGNDTLSFAARGGGGVIFDFVTQLISNSAETYDGYVVSSKGAFKNFENVIGTATHDTLRGSSGVNVLSGGAGDDVIEGRGGADTLYGGAGNDTLEGGAGGDTLDGGAGIDTLSYASDMQPTDFGVEWQGGITVDLAADKDADGYIVLNDAANTYMWASSLNSFSRDAHGVGDKVKGFENITGGGGDDRLTGDAGVNTLIGGQGADTIEGGAGADRLIGGAKIGQLNQYYTNGSGQLVLDSYYDDGDTLSYASDVIGVTVDLDKNIVSGGDAAGDVIYGFRNATGGSGDDTLIAANLIGQFFGAGVKFVPDGNARDIGVEYTAGSALNGGAGDDTLIAGVAADTLNGGDGNDTVSYAKDTLGVRVELGINGQEKKVTGSGNEHSVGTKTIKSYAADDVIANVENLIGGAGNDTLIGNALANVLEGGAGDDILEGRGGADTYIGGTGYDTVSYNDLRITGITINLADTALITRGAAGSTYISIEQIIGSHFSDSIIGDDGDNVLDGNLGGDTISGGAGNDTLTGGGGFVTDTIDGGAGSDTLSYRGTSGNLVIDLAGQDSTGVNYYTITATSNTEARSDRIKNIENLIGGRGNDTLSGDSNDNIIDGGDGSDTLDGGAGNDTVSYAASSTFVEVRLTYSTKQTTLTRAEIEALNSNSPTPSFTIITTAGYATHGNELVDVSLTDPLVTDVTISINGVDTTVKSYKGFQLTDGSGNRTGFKVAKYADTLANFENIIGSNFDDSLMGNDKDNIIEGGAGQDTLDGRGGLDFASYANAGAGVIASLGTPVDNRGSDAYGDIYENIEGLEGSRFADTLIGDDGNNVFRGGDGFDTLNGGGGYDTLDYSGETQSVVLHFYQSVAGYSVARIGGLAADRVKNMENIDGGMGNDTLSGDGTNNVITGGMGNDTLVGRGGNDVLIGGAGDDVIDGGAGPDWLIGGTGTDTLSYASDTKGVTINMGQAAETTGQYAGYIMASGRPGSGDFTTINNGTHAESDGFKGFENLRGGWGNDTLYGDGAANVIEGGAGDDRLLGGGGADTLYGGAGVDFLDYSGRGSGLSLSLASVTADGAGYYTVDGDRVKSVEGIIATDYADTLTAGGGIYTISYAVSDAAVTVSLVAGASNSGGYAAGDTLSGFKHIVGSASADTLTGDGGDNVLEGGLGGDALNGGAGSDTASYANAAAGADAPVGQGEAAGSNGKLGVTANLASNSSNTGEAVGDTYSGIENLIGSNYNDTLTGDANANVIEGGAGNDTIDGAGGSDTLSYASDTFGVTIDLGQTAGSGGYIVVADYHGSHAANDKFKNMENVTGGSGYDHLTGNSAVNVLSGGDGHDWFSGGGGADTLYGGAGKDSFMLELGNSLRAMDVVKDFESGDLIMVDTSAGSESSVSALQSAAQISWTNNSNSSGTSANDTIISWTGGGSSTVVMVLEDYSDALAITDFYVF